MKTTYRFFLSLLLCMLAGISYAQDNILYYMGSLPHSTHMNPARRTNYGTTVVLPASNLAFSARSLASFNEMFSKNESGEYVMDYPKLLASLDDGENPMVFDASTELLGVYIKTKKGTFNFSLTTGINSYTGFEKDMVGMFAKGLGHEDYIGRDVEIAPTIDFMHYHKLMIGGSRQMNEKLNVGANLNFLMGQAAFSMNNASLKVRQDGAPNYAISTNSNAVAYTAGYANSIDLTESSISADALVDSFMEDPTGAAFSTSNMGFTLDLGATYQFSEKLFFEASVRNLGKQITFKKELQKYNVELEDESLAFDGIDPAELANGEDITFINTDDDLYAFEKDGESGEFKIALPTTFMAGARYELTRTTTTGAMISGTSYRDDFFTTFAVSIDQEVGDFVGVGLSYGVNKFGHQVGTALTVGFPGMKVYVATDNALAAITALDTKTMNFRAGITLNFGRKLEADKNKLSRKERKQIESQENTETDTTLE